MTTLKLLGYCRDNDWAGYDPYDALNSKIVSFLPFLNFRFFRLAITQLLKRSPLNLRPLLLVPKTQNPKVIGLFLSAFVNLSRAGITIEQDYIPHLAERLDALRTPGLTQYCWGDNFPWQTRTELVPIWAPSVVNTAFAAYGLLDAFELRQDDSYLSMALSAAEYLLDNLYWTSGESVSGFGYPLREVHNQVHNANLLGAALFSRVYQHTGKEKFLAPALGVTRYTMTRQRADGGWLYGERYTQNWIDNFHTAFNLSALHMIGTALATSEFEEPLSRGLQFYRANFFLPSGAVRYFHDRTYPIDAHCVAQSIIALIDLKDLDPTNVQLARSIYDWAINHMWNERESFFYYRVLRSCTIRTSYMRWTQASMFLALTKLLAESASSLPDTPHPVPGEVS